MTPANPLTIVGLLLTLASLLGSFFYLQLSQWLRDVMALRQKIELNSAQGDEPQKRAIVECRVELRRLSTWHSYIINLVVIGFVSFIMVLGIQMVNAAKTDPLYAPVHQAMTVFFAIFLLLSLGLLLLGGYHASWIARKLNAI
jgi:amino acid transporter